MTDSPNERADESTRPADLVLSELPDLWPTSLLDSIDDRLSGRDERLVVIDDDPTGTQTVFGVPVLMAWTPEVLRREMSASPIFYISTNSRALDHAAAERLALEIGGSLRSIAADLGCRLTVASRSDSTLRGHYSAETDALTSALGVDLDGTILVPYFGAGGRLTIDDVHFVRQGADLVPAARTEFANDATFGFENSHLPEWVAERTSGLVAANDVISIGLDLLRKDGPEAVAARLLELTRGENHVIVVNATDDRDLEVFVSGLLEAESEGRRYLYRTAASFVRVRAGIGERPLLTGSEICNDGSNGGLLVVGSHVDRSTRQLEQVSATTDAICVELDVHAVLDPDRAAEAIARASKDVDAFLAAGTDAVLHTSRTLVTADSPEASLDLSTRVSQAVCAVVRGLTEVPRFLIAKGGITSSTVATDALGVRRAMVLGQLQPGVPVWRLGDESSMPGTAYVVYPGNVGDDNGLADAIRTMRS